MVARHNKPVDRPTAGLVPHRLVADDRGHLITRKCHCPWHCGPRRRALPLFERRTLTADQGIKSLRALTQAFVGDFMVLVDRARYSYAKDLLMFVSGEEHTTPIVDTSVECMVGKHLDVSVLSGPCARAQSG